MADIEIERIIGYNIFMIKDPQQRLEHQRAWYRAWYKANRDKKGLSRHKWDLSLKGRYASYRKHARTANREFSITLEEFSSIVDKPCYYCHSTEKIGIDRTDSYRGYTIDNCTPCCWNCNKLKGTRGKEDFINHCKKIAANF